MKARNAATVLLTLLVLLTIGCQQEMDKSVVVFVDDVQMDQEPYTGHVFIGDADDKFGNDRYVLNATTITDDVLAVSLSYSGGCKAHQFTLVVSDEFHESFPVQIDAVIVHNANGDTCEAWPTEEYHFDLTPIKTLYQNAYRQEAGTIILRLKDAPDGELVYEFDM